MGSGGGGGGEGNWKCDAWSSSRQEKSGGAVFLVSVSLHAFLSSGPNTCLWNLDKGNLSWRGRSYLFIIYALTFREAQKKQ